MLAGMTLFDWFVVVVIVLSTIMAAAQGLVLELVSLAALVLGLWLAFWNYHVLATPLSHVIHSEGVVAIGGVAECGVSSAIACGMQVKIPSDSMRPAAIDFLGHAEAVRGNWRSGLRARTLRLEFRELTTRCRRGTQLNIGFWRRRFCVGWIFATRQYTTLPEVGSLPRAYQLHRWKNSVLPARRPL